MQFGVDEGSIVDIVEQMRHTLLKDRDEYDAIHSIASGESNNIRVPKGVDPSVRIIAKRAVANFLPLAIAVPAQLSIVDGYYRMSTTDDKLLTSPPEWRIWNRSGFRSKQTTLFKTALKYGVSYAAIDNSVPGDPRIKILSTRNTMAYFVDPINDLSPSHAITIIPSGRPDVRDSVVYYDSELVVDLEYNGTEYTIVNVHEHGLGACPIVRFHCYIDDDGVTSGVVDQLKVAQDRVNQTVFDLLVTQTFSSTRIRWAAGLQGEPVLDSKGDPIQDENGFTVFKPMTFDQTRVLLTDNPDAKFGSLDETPLQGFIDSFDSAVKTMAVLGSIPPHSLLGSMANLSAESISAAMGQTARHTRMLQAAWAEGIKELMRMIRIELGELAGDDYDDEVRWRDMSDASMAQVSDALGKLASTLEVPAEGLWSRIPGATDAEVLKWRIMKSSSDALLEEDALGVEGSVKRETLGVFGEPESIVLDDTTPVDGR